MQKTEYLAARPARARRRVYRFLGAIPALLALAAASLLPGAAVQGAREGLELCLEAIIPSLFPFFVLSSMLISLGLPHLAGRVAAPVMKRLFGVSGEGAAAFMLGIIGGYPLGAKAVADIYESGGCTRDEAERLLGVCNNCGPAFILGVTGAGVFGRADIGLLLYATHVLAAIAVGMLTRPRPGAAPARAEQRTLRETPGLAAAFTDSVKASFTSCLNICGFIVFFSVLLSLLRSGGVFAGLAKTPLAESLLIGMIEISGGIASLNGLYGVGAVSAAAFILGWGGLSVHAQVMSVLGGTGLSPARLIVCRAMHGIIAAALCAAGFLLLLR